METPAIPMDAPTTAAAISITVSSSSVFIVKDLVGPKELLQPCGKT
jgi:hypothetical protein